MSRKRSKYLAFNHPTPDLVSCPYKRCKVYGESLDCYLDNHHNCETYLRWRAALDLHVRRAEKKEFFRNLKNERFK